MAARQQHKTKNILITVGIFLLIVLAVGMFGILTHGFQTLPGKIAIAGKDAGEAIEVIKEGNVFLLEFGTLPEIISGLIGEPVTMEEKDGEQDLFLMTVSSGKNEINIEFTSLVPTEITLPDEIIF